MKRVRGGRYARKCNENLVQYSHNRTSAVNVNDKFPTMRITLKAIIRRGSSFLVGIFKPSFVSLASLAGKDNMSEVKEHPFLG